MLPFLCPFHRRGREKRIGDKLSAIWRRSENEEASEALCHSCHFPYITPRGGSLIRRLDHLPHRRNLWHHLGPLPTRHLKKPSRKKKLPPSDLDSSASGPIATLIIATSSIDGTWPSTTFVNCLVSVTEDGYSSSLISTETNSKRLKTVEFIMMLILGRGINF